MRNQEIADQLFISLPTVKRHIANAYGKLGVGHRTEARRPGERAEPAVKGLAAVAFSPQQVGLPPVSHAVLGASFRSVFPKLHPLITPFG